MFKIMDCKFMMIIAIGMMMMLTLNAYSVPGTILNALGVMTYLIFIMNYKTVPVVITIMQIKILDQKVE